LSNISKYRVASPIFNLTLPANNNLGLDPQVTESVSDGYWIILEPLPKGNHTIITSGAIIEPTGVYSFVSDVTWKINIKSPPLSRNKEIDSKLINTTAI